jgi:predicted DNA-binding protein (MmcQ/YjbR family)
MTTDRPDGGVTISALEEFALGMPEAWPDTPWGDRVVKVRTKIFVFLAAADADRPVITVKLPESTDHALSYPGAAPTGYGLGKHGWVTIPIHGVPEEERDVLLDFVEESYRAVAPKQLVRRLDAELAGES